MSKHDVEESDMGNNNYNKAIQSQFVGQWITSLAISVVCCAILFVVFAGYMVKLHEKTNLADLRIELLQEKHTQIVNELAAIRRQPPQTVFNLQGVAPVNVTQQPQPEQPAQGVKIDEESGKIDNDPALNQEPAPEAVPNSVSEPAIDTPSDAAKPDNKSKMDLGVPTYNPPENMKPIVR